jgi:hypothetical protein
LAALSSSWQVAVRPQYNISAIKVSLLSLRKQTSEFKVCQLAGGLKMISQTAQTVAIIFLV